MAKKILVVDDDDRVRKCVVQVLTVLGDYQVVTAAGGEEGCRLALEQKPDAVLLDIDMPGIDGGDVAAFLLKNPQTRDIPIIFLTGLANGTEIDPGGTIGGRRFMAKPFRSEDLIKMVKSVLKEDV